MNTAAKWQSFPRIAKMSAEVRATEALRDQIIGGLLPPGSRITETKVSQGMGLSRATIRTALHQLAKEGLLNLVPYTGWTVIELTREDVWELYTLRAAVERLAAQLAAAKADNKAFDCVNAAFVRLEREVGKGDSLAIADADFSFHKAIVDAAAHSRLTMQYAVIEQQIKVYIRSSDALVANPAEIIAQHQPMHEAILASDVAEAGRLAEEHNLTEGEKLVQSLAAES